MNLLCEIGLHNWKIEHLYTVKRLEHCVDLWAENNKLSWHNGRICKWCGKEQYLHLYWTTVKYFDVLKKGE